MEKFLKQNWFKVATLIMGFLVVVILYTTAKSPEPIISSEFSTSTVDGSSTTPQGTFDSRLVLEKRNCQDAVKKWSEENNSHTGWPGNVTTFHFNSSLNTCLISYFEENKDGSWTKSIMDIYDGNKILLELYFFPKQMCKSEYSLLCTSLYEKGIEIKVSDPVKEFEARSNIILNN